MMFTNMQRYCQKLDIKIEIQHLIQMNIVEILKIATVHFSCVK